MSESPARYYLTTPIYYVNARPHIGHAYTTIVADVLARRHRMQGENVLFLTGTDEHGQKIERSARAAGIPPQQFTDQVSAEFRQLWDRMGLTYDQYIRTTDDAHKRGVQKLFRELQGRDQIYLSSYTGQYCVSEEIFVEGPPGTIGPDGRPTETVTEENYFFRLSNYQLKLIDLIESDELEVQPEARKNELLSFLRGPVSQHLSQPPVILSEARSAESKDPENASQTATADPLSPQIAYSAAGHPYVPGALRDLSISRSSFTWGIPVPGDDKHVIYVWLDALANYITAVGYGDDSPEAEAKFATYWPADLHLVGKEIIRQHCIYWPAFLMAAGLDLPKKVVAHGWLLFEESKMSKSRGNIVRTETILDAFGTLCPALPASLGPAPLPNAPPPPDLSSLAAGGGSAVPTHTTASDLATSPQPLSSRSEAERSASLSPAATPSKHDQDLFAADVLRYFLLREIPFGQDGSFSFDAMITRYNAELANGYGNLVSRTSTMIRDYFESIVAPSDPFGTSSWEEGEEEHFWSEIMLQGSSNWTTYNFGPSVSPARVSIYKLAGQSITLSQLEDPSAYLGALTSITSSLVQSTDLYLSETSPWRLIKSGSSETKKAVEEILYVAAESLRITTALLCPILPYATANVWRQLGLGDIEEAAARGELTNLQWGGLKPGTKLGPLSPIFPRADKGLAQIMADMEQAKTAAAAPSTPEPADPTHPAAGPRTATLAEPNPGAQVAGSTAETTERPGTPPHGDAAASGIFAQASAQPAQPADAVPQIGIEDFMKVELRVAKVLVCERIPKADKLLRLEVDLGYEQRQILSGIAEWYTPEELIGRRIVVITNLAPRKMRGLDSHGMLLATSAPTVEGEKPGKPALATFADTDTLPLGARLR